MKNEVQKMLTEKDKEELRAFLKSKKWMNGGVGLIIPKSMADLFKENGITEDYVVNEYISILDRKPSK